MSEEVNRCTRLKVNDWVKQQQRVSVQTVLRGMRGGSQSNLVRCDDSKMYVMKMSKNPQGPNVLANEFLGSYLLSALGISSPPMQSIVVSDDTAKRYPSLAFEMRSHKMLPQNGVHFGSQFLDTTGHRIYDWIPPTRYPMVLNPADFVGIYVFDIWTGHQDQRQCIYRQDEYNGSIQAFFIDNGHLFGGPDWASFHVPCRSLMIPQMADRVRRNDLIETWISHIRTEGARLLAEGIDLVPAQWYSGNISGIERRLRARLVSLDEIVADHISRTAKTSEKTSFSNGQLQVLHRNRMFSDGTLGQGSSFAAVCSEY